MELIRCDRCKAEYRGEETYLYFPYLSSDSWCHRSPTRWDLCSRCRVGLEEIFTQVHRSIRMYLSPAFVDRERQFIVDWYRHLVVVDPIIEDPFETKQLAEEERIREGCAKLLTAPEYANDLICRFCGGYRVDHRVGQPGPGTAYPKRR